MQKINSTEDGLPDVGGDSDIEIGQYDDIAREDELEVRGQGRSKKSPISWLLKLSVYGVFGIVFVCVALMIYLKSLPKRNDEMQLVQSQVDLVSGKSLSDQDQLENSTKELPTNVGIAKNSNDAPKLSTHSVLTQKVVDTAVDVSEQVSDQYEKRTSELSIRASEKDALLAKASEPPAAGLNQPLQSEVMVRIDEIARDVSTKSERLDNVSNQVRTTQEETASVKSQIESATDRIKQIEADNTEIKNSISSLAERIQSISTAPKNSASNIDENTQRQRSVNTAAPSVPAPVTTKKPPSVVQPPLVKPLITFWGNEKFVQFNVNGSPYEVREGEILAGWKIVSIQSDSIDVVKVAGGSVVKISAPGG